MCVMFLAQMGHAPQKELLTGADASFRPWPLFGTGRRKVGTLILLGVEGKNK